MADSDKRKTSMRRESGKAYATRRSETSSSLLSQYLNDLEEWSHGRKDWGSEGSEPPDESALKRAEESLQLLNSLGFLPQKIAPSAEGGVALVFKNGDKRAMLEFFNDGSSSGVLYDLVDEVKVIAVDQESEMSGIVERIRAYLEQDT